MAWQSKGALVAKVSKALARARVAIRWGKETCRMRWNRDQFLPFEGGHPISALCQWMLQQGTHKERYSEPSRQ